MFPVASEAKIAVAVVPILAPIISGNIASIVRIPAATRGIIKAIVIELLWTMAVKMREAKIASMPCLPIMLFRTISALLAISDLISFTMKYRARNNNIKEMISNKIYIILQGKVSFMTVFFIKAMVGFVANFIGLVKIMPPQLVNKTLIHLAALLNKPKVSSRGNSKHTHIILKKSCTVPPVIAFLNSSRRPIWPNDTNVFVTVVPIFVPMTMGIAVSMGIIPEPTMPTTIEVVVDEL